MKTKLFITTFLLLSFASYGQVDSTKIKVNEESKIKESVKKDSQKETLTELDYYKLLSEQSKKDNETYISLFQWTIGISFGFLLAIIGSQIFFNYRISKKEIDYIKKDIDEKIAELKNDLIESIDEKINNLRIESSADFDKSERKLLKIIDESKANFINLKKEISDDFDKSEKQLIDKLSKQFNSLNHIVDLRISSTNDKIEHKTKELKNRIEKNEGDLWKLKGVESNALSSFLRSAEIQLELGSEVKYILDDIISILSNLEEIHQFDYNKLDSLTEKIKQTHKTKSDKILELYKDKPVYKFTNKPSEEGLLGMFGGFSTKEYVKNKK